MRIHSDYLRASDARDAMAGLPVYATRLQEHGSRSHDNAIELILSGSSNSRQNGGDDMAATWDEWGVVIARLFNLDANAVFGSVKHPNYANAEDFHRKTGDRFRSLELPEDTHQRHNWVSPSPFYEPGGLVARPQTCSKCSATVRY